MSKEGGDDIECEKREGMFSLRVPAIRRTQKKEKVGEGLEKRGLKGRKRRGRIRDNSFWKGGATERQSVERESPGGSGGFKRVV